ncbi:MAG: PEP-CTERM sorting domain-containing protein [Phycisphaera sp. RhM]|nr:PEP-CTERM sorting domain-containing protein [Phycisphaera sp. RhM]
MMTSVSLKLRFSLAVLLLLLTAGPPEADAGVMATLAIENANPSVAGPGQTVRFDVWLRDLVTDSPTDFVEAFNLDFSGSDAALTAILTSFDFQLDPGLTGILGGIVFDDDASDEGMIGYGADVAPLGTETGIYAWMGDTRLGQLSFSAPSNAGTYAVSFALDNTDPFSPTFLIVNDGLFGQFVPTDGSLTVNAASFNVDVLSSNPVPEPGAIWMMVATVVLAGVRRRQRSDV